MNPAPRRDRRPWKPDLRPLPPAPIGVFQPVSPVAAGRVLPNTPELRLIAEVLLDAVELVTGSRHSADRTPKAAEAARLWIESGDVGLISSTECCEALGWNAWVTRRAIFSSL